MAGSDSSGASPWLLVGLGNPGREYAHNRHNVGFMAVERWLDRQLPAGVGSPWREKFHARVATVSLPSPSGLRVVVIEPQTYMNRSGHSVVAAMQFHRVPREQLVVVHDELDFDFGRLAVKKGGGHGGHNGLRDIISQCGGNDFLRLRLGIGHPGTAAEVVDYVLRKAPSSEQQLIERALDDALRVLPLVVRDEFERAMQTLHTRAPA